MEATAGLQVPLIPLVELPGNDGTDPPAQMVSEVPKLNTGTTFGRIVVVKVVGTAHCPAVGVNV